MNESIRSGISGTAANDEAFVRRNTKYPFLIVRIFAAWYQRETIAVRVGPPAVEFVNRSCFIRHPAPFESDGTVSPACRELLLAGVLDAVRRGPFRMCVVWGPGICSYVETDGVFDSTVPPSGGVLPVELEFKPRGYEPDDPVADGPNPEST